MSSKKKKGGLKRTNKSQQTTIGKDPPTGKSGKSGLKRADKNKSSDPKEKAPKTVRRTDKNVTSSEPTAKKGIARGDKGARSVEPTTVKSVQRRDKNASAAPTKQVKTRKIHATATKQSQGEKQQFGGSKSDRMNQTSSSLGLENATISAKKGIRDANQSIKEVTKKTGITRKNPNVQKSREAEPKTKGKAKPGAASAFAPSSAEVKTSTVRPAKKGGGAFSQSTGTKKTTSGLRSTSKPNSQQQSSNIFGGSGGSAPAKAKNTAHMASSFTFG